MLDRSAVFETYAGVSGHQRSTILAIEQGSDVLYFSTRPMPNGLNTNPVYPLLVTHTSLNESIDIFTKQWKVANVSFVLTNQQFYPSSGSVAVRASELLENINGSACSIYLWVDGIDDIADCLLIFQGIILETPTVDKNSVYFAAEDKSKLLDIEIPLRSVKDEYPDAHPEVANSPIPLVYGDFSVADPYFIDANATGLARAVSTSGNLNEKYLLADHALASIVKEYQKYKVNGVMPADSITSSNDPDDSGIAWIITGQHFNMFFFMRTDGTLPGIYNEENVTFTQAGRQALAAGLVQTDLGDNNSDNGSASSGMFPLAIEEEDAFLLHYFGAGSESRIYGAYTDLKADGDRAVNQINTILIQIAASTKNTGETILRSCDAWVRLGSNPPIFNAVVIGTFGAPCFEGDPFASESETENIEQHALCVFRILTGDGDGTLNNEVLASLKHVRLLLKTTMPWIGYAWAACVGKTDGTPVHIIEDLFKEHIGLTDDDLDLDSLAYIEGLEPSPSQQMRVNIIERTSSFELIKQILEQSTFTIHLSGAGKLRWIPLNDKTPTTNETIYRHHLVDDDFKLFKTTQIVNSLEVHSRWQEEYERFRDLNLYQDASSQSEFFVRPAEFKWKYIFGDDVDEVAQLYVNSTDGIWSKPHIGVTFTSPGFTHSHLQVGDWIEFNSEIDDVNKAYSSSWSGKQMLVTKIERNSDSNTITAIELFEN